MMEEGMSSWESLEAAGETAGSSSDLDALMADHHQMPFLQMLRGAMQAGVKEEQEQTFLSSYHPIESHSQLLLRLQQQSWSVECNRAAVEPVDSCVTHASPPAKERRKRKRARTAAAASSKNAEEAESQRMAHIAVERNRRRLMNNHLAALRALMPPSFAHRGDQASIVGGAIEFVKELELLLLSLRAKKLARAFATSASSCSSSSCASSPSTALSRSSEEEAACDVEDLFVAPQYRGYSQSGGEEWGMDVEAVVVQGHVGLKVAGRRRPGQLVRAVAALEELRFHVLHLTVMSLGPSAVLYSLNLKMEEQCKLVSPDEIATAVHQIFAYINAAS